MATLRQLRYDLYQLIRANGFDDDDLDPRVFTFWVNNTRASIVRDYILKLSGKGLFSLPDNFYQDLGIFDLEVLDNEFGSKVGRFINVTTKEIPKVLYKDSHPLIKVLPLDLRVPSIKIVSNKNINGVGEGLFNNRMVYAFLDHNKVHLTGAENNYYVNLIKKIRILAVLENPEDDPNFNLDAEYPIDTSMIPYLEEKVAKTYLYPMLNLKNDPNNNAKNDLN
jgi:hypothetical protein